VCVVENVDAHTRTAPEDALKLKLRKILGSIQEHHFGLFDGDVGARPEVPDVFAVPLLIHIGEQRENLAIGWVLIIFEDAPVKHADLRSKRPESGCFGCAILVDLITLKDRSVRPLGEPVVEAAG